MPTFEDYQSEKKILHYSHLTVAMNIKIERDKGRPANKVLWTISMDEHETIIDALQMREDVDGIVGWRHLSQTHVIFFLGCTHLAREYSICSSLSLGAITT